MAMPRTLFTGLMGLILGVFAQTATAVDPAERRPGGVGPEYEVRTFQAADGNSLRYGWLTPKQAPANSTGEKYPLVVCLHGRGGNSTAADVLVAPKLRDKYPCYVFVPDSGRTWWAVTPGRGEPGDPKNLPHAVEAIRSLLKSEPIDPARVYVTGQSMGGIGSWAAAARYPDLFAAAAPVCGEWSVDDVPKMLPVAIWNFHGDKDATVSVEPSRKLVAALKQAGGNVKYTEFTGVGHASWVPAYAMPELWAWLFEQRKVAADQQADKK